MLRVIAGCYEQMLLGYTIHKNDDEDSTYPFRGELEFTDHSHSGCVKAVTAGESYLASGGTDETVFLIDLNDKKEVGSLQGHEGSITHLSFPDKNYLMSSSDDGAINLWKVSAKWNKVKSLRGHRGPVSSFDVHPSGKLALSVSSKDGTLRTWNMLSGRAVYVKNLKKFCPETVKFSPGDGELYLIASSTNVQVCKLENAVCIADISLEKSILCTEFLSKDIVAVAGEEGVIYIHSTQDGSQLCSIESHTSRVKALHRIITPASFSNPEESVWFGSISSDGYFKIWSVNVTDMKDKNKTTFQSPKCILAINTKARLTCFTSWSSES